MEWFLNTCLKYDFNTKLIKGKQFLIVCHNLFKLLKILNLNDIYSSKQDEIVLLLFILLFTVMYQT
jgi:hypothetical protein